MSMRYVSCLLLAIEAFSTVPARAEVTAEKSADKVVVRIDGQPFAEYLTRSGTKPVVWPIFGPTGRPVTRAFPMGPAADTKDHVHHRSLWFSHGNVNGFDIWSERPGRSGTIRHREFADVSGGRTAVIVARNDWLAPDGRKVCEDLRRLEFGGDGRARWIDFDITLTASEGPVRFGDTKEGTFAVRVADSMRVDARAGGRIVNSAGQTNGAAWGKPADWIDCQGPVDGQTLGIAIFCHPQCFRYPNRWHAREYGLIGANPFGLAAFTGDRSNSGAFTLAAGKSITLCYRVVLHVGDEREGRLAEAYADYAKVANGGPEKPKMAAAAK